MLPSALLKLATVKRIKPHSIASPYIILQIPIVFVPKSGRLHNFSNLISSNFEGAHTTRKNLGLATLKNNEIEISYFDNKS
jgi:hypothetical protein